MKLPLLAALALIAPSALHAQAAPAVADLTTAMPAPGNWTYGPVTGGTEAIYSDNSGRPQLWLHCTRATRQVTVSKPAAAAAPSISIWTSTMVRAVPASFKPATGRLNIEIASYDPLLDAMAFSRGRIGFSVGSQAALVVPPWEEVARVVEDCRV
jgi:hypothetical protein